MQCHTPHFVFQSRFSYNSISFPSHISNDNYGDLSPWILTMFGLKVRYSRHQLLTCRPSDMPLTRSTTIQNSRQNLSSRLSTRTIRFRQPVHVSQSTQLILHFSSSVNSILQCLCLR